MNTDPFVLTVDALWAFYKPLLEVEMPGASDDLAKAFRVAFLSGLSAYRTAYRGGLATGLDPGIDAFEDELLCRGLL